MIYAQKKIEAGIILAPSLAFSSMDPLPQWTQLMWIESQPITCVFLLLGFASKNSNWTFIHLLLHTGNSKLLLCFFLWRIPNCCIIHKLLQNSLHDVFRGLSCKLYYHSNDNKLQSSYGSCLVEVPHGKERVNTTSSKRTSKYITK